MLDRVRVYTTALTEDQIAENFKNEAAEYGFDTTWFSRLKVKPYYYLERGEVVIEVDFKGLQPLRGHGQLEVTLAAKNDPGKILARKVVEQVRARVGIEDVAMACEDLAKGEYLIRVQIRDDQEKWPVEEISFSYPPERRPVISPAEKIVNALAPQREPIPFDVQVHQGGGFTVIIKDGSYPFESRISWPRGDFNRLADSDSTSPPGEANMEGGCFRRIWVEAL